MLNLFVKARGCVPAGSPPPLHSTETLQSSQSFTTKQLMVPLKLIKLDTLYFLMPEQALPHIPPVSTVFTYQLQLQVL